MAAAAATAAAAGSVSTAGASAVQEARDLSALVLKLVERYMEVALEFKRLNCRWGFHSIIFAGSSCKLDIAPLLQAAQLQPTCPHCLLAEARLTSPFPCVSTPSQGPCARGPPQQRAHVHAPL